MPKEYKILLSIALGAIILGVILFKFAGAPAQQIPLATRSGAYEKGNAQGRIVVTEFADFQCPACRQAHDVVSRLLRIYPNDVKFVFRHFPLSSHPYAMISAQAAEAAGAQGKFWEMSDLLYEKQSDWGDLAQPLERGAVIGLFGSYAQQLGIDSDAVQKAIEANKYSDIINQDISAGSASGVNATPTFFVNGVKISEPSFEAIETEVKKQLNP